MRLTLIIAMKRLREKNGDKCSDLVHWENLEGMGGEGGGRGDRDGEHM